MNVEIGAEAAQFPEREYISGIAVAEWPGKIRPGRVWLVASGLGTGNR